MFTNIPGSYVNFVDTTSSEVALAPEPELSTRSTPTRDILFTNVTKAVGLGGVTGSFFAWGDYNNDSYQDLLIDGRRLFRNSGPPDWDFTEVTSSSGITDGAGVWADYNNDGWLDTFGRKLWCNNGDGTFTDVTAIALPDYDGTYVAAAGWGDYDRDGWVDLYVARGENWNEGDPIYYPNFLYRNNGDGTFTNVTESAGVSDLEEPKYSRGVNWADYNNDGWLDIYVSNYRQLPNYLYENNGNGTFTEVGAEKGVADGPPRTEGNLDPYDRAGHSVGAAWADYDNDGYLDLWVSNLNHKDIRTSDDSLLYHNEGPPDYTFINMRAEAGIPVKPYLYPNEGDELFVGCAWGDFDNDGDLDLFIPQIYNISYAYSFLYRNNGDGTFTDITEEAGVRVWDTYGGCWCDYNSDGFLDLITGGRAPYEGGKYEVHLYRGTPNDNSWLQLSLVGVESNRAAIGTAVRVRAGNDWVQLREVEGGMGCHSHQNSLPLEFGFGNYHGKVDIEIRWANGKVQYLFCVDLNQHLIVREELIPDLEAAKINFSTDNPRAGDTIYIYATIRNRGNTVAELAEVRFYADKIEASEMIGDMQYVTALSPHSNESVTLSCTWTIPGGSGGTTYTIYVQITNCIPAEDNLANNLASEQLAVQFNQPPVAKLVVSPEVAYVGDSIMFDGSESYDDVAVTLYYFYFGDGNSEGWTSTSKVTHTYAVAGKYIAKLKVQDNEGAVCNVMAEVEVKIMVKPNEPPIAIIDTILPNPGEVGDVIEFRGHGIDYDGEIIAYAWYSSLIGQLGTTATVSRVITMAGTHRISFKVQDDAGEWSEEAYAELVVVREPSKPEVTITSPLDNEVVSGIIIVRGKAYDPLYAILRVELKIDPGGVWVDATGTRSWTYRLDTTKLSDGTHEIYVRAYNVYLNCSEVVSVTFIVRNRDYEEAPAAVAAAGDLIDSLLIFVALVTAVTVILYVKRRKSTATRGRH
jgi:hypothetical protein